MPAAIGINIHDPAVKRLAEADGSFAYGGISPPCARPCISPLHTHDTSGILHTEAKVDEFNNLGEFFIEWNVRLDANCIATYCKPATDVVIYMNGTRFDGDPRTIALSDRKEIAFVVGTPPAEIPNTAF